MTNPRVKKEELHFAKLNNARFNSLMNACIQFPAQHGMPTDHVAALALAAFSPNVNVLNTIMGTETDYSMRKELDDNVDDIWSFLVNMLEAHAKGFNVVKKEAATELLNVFNTFDKNLNALPYNAQYTMLRSVLDIWEATASMEHFVTLGLQEELISLRFSYVAFSQYDIERASANNDGIPTTREVRRELKQAFTLWINLLEAMANLNMDEFCYQTLLSINILLKEQSTYLKSKSTRKTSDEIDEE